MQIVGGGPMSEWAGQRVGRHHPHHLVHGDRSRRREGGRGRGGSPLDNFSTVISNGWRVGPKRCRPFRHPAPHPCRGGPPGRLATCCAVLCSPVRRACSWRWPRLPSAGRSSPRSPWPCWCCRCAACAPGRRCSRVWSSASATSSSCSGGCVRSAGTHGWPCRPRRRWWSRRWAVRSPWSAGSVGGRSGRRCAGSRWRRSAAAGRSAGCRGAGSPTPWPTPGGRRPCRGWASLG